jgi:PucR C-terminal helix-turn-helix domain/GGDEF-like domain
MIESQTLRANEWSLSLKQSDSVVKALSERADALVADLVQTIAATPKVISEPAWMPPPVVGHTTCVANVRSVLAAMVSPSAFDPEPAMENGADRARQGMTLSTLIESDRIAFRRLWRMLVDEADQHPAIDAQVVQHMTANLHVSEELFATAMFAGYRNEQQRQMVEKMAQGTVMIDTLLYGHAHDTWRLWEIANYLRLPTEGPFAVIAAELPCAGYEALPSIEAKLRSLDVFSAWRLLPDIHVGIAHIASDHHRDNVIALLTRMATRRIGVSACFDDLRDTPVALHFAKVSLRGQDQTGGKVAVFDGSMLATAAVSAPSVMVKSAAVALEGFGDLPLEEREMLYETFRAWVDSDASVRASADVLFVHPNTVRKRLHRIEQRTGRSLTRRRDVIELSLALEVHRRLMRPDGPSHTGVIGGSIV